METQLIFPAGFRWGAATAAYQIEGAVAEDGRAPSIWDTFSHTPGPSAGRRHRRRRDRPLPPVPRGRRADGRARADGVPLLDRLAADPAATATRPGQPSGAGLLPRPRRRAARCRHRPVVTLYHWDLPQALEDAGGWPVRDTAYRFADYAGLVARRPSATGSRIHHGERAWCAAYLGYACGDHAPGRREPEAALRAAHHLLLGHGLAVRELRGDRCERGRGGQPLRRCRPASEAPEDVDAARRIDGLQNRFFLDAMLRGRYPEDVLADLERYDLGVRDGDLDHDRRPRRHARRQLLQPLLRHRHGGRAHRGDLAVRGSRRLGPAASTSGSSRPAAGDRDGLGGRRARASTELLARVAGEYRPVPLYVTENGAAVRRTGADGGVEDQDRIAYLDAAPARLPRRDRATGVAAARVLRLVTAGQLRVGLGIREALRPGARRLRDADGACPRPAPVGTPA